MAWTTSDMPDQSGRVAIVTGANSGIGYETALALADRGAHVILACRNAQKGQAAIDDLQTVVPDASAELASLDLSNLDSIKSFAEDFQERHERLDLLINNAGVMMPPLSHTDDGFELQFGTNHLGHYALTGHLIDILGRTEASRVVTVSSLAHHGGRIDFENLSAERGYSKMKAYAQSKLANLLFMRELSSRLKRSGSTTTSYAAHPGWTNTNLQSFSPIVERLNPIFAQEPADGALPTLRAATDPEAAPGSYFGPSKRFELIGPPTEARRSKRAKDDTVASKLWRRSAELTDLSYL